MKILFFNPSAELRKSLNIYRILWSPVPPLWAGYLAAIAKEFAEDVKVIDNCVELMDLKGSFEKIKEFSPDVLCISVLTQTATFSFKLAKAVKNALPKTKVIMGGPHASYFAPSIVQSGLADAVVVGEGEETFREILQNLSEDGIPHAQKGVVFKADGKVIQTPNRPRIKNLDELPTPAWELFKKYFRYYKPLPPNPPKRPVFTFLASRGCPYNCSFCMVQMGRNYVIRSSQSICDELEIFNADFGCRHFWFVDPLFPPPSKKKALEVLSYMAERIGRRKGREKITWDCETRADLIDDEVAEALKEAGCELVAIGVESGDDKVLNAVNKKLDVSRIKKAVKSLKKHKIRIMGLYMIGNPGETVSSFLKTLRFAKELGVDASKFSVAVPYPGTELWEKYINGKFQFSEDDWEKFSSYSFDFPYPMYWTNIPQEKIKYLQLIANLYVNIKMRNILVSLWHVISSVS